MKNTERYKEEIADLNAVIKRHQKLDTLIELDKEKEAKKLEKEGLDMDEKWKIKKKKELRGHDENPTILFENEY